MIWTTLTNQGAVFYFKNMFPYIICMETNHTKI
jgi:hypothetical protein